MVIPWYSMSVVLASVISFYMWHNQAYKICIRTPKSGVRVCVRGSDEMSRKLCTNPLRNDCIGKKTEFQARWSTPWRRWTKFELWSVPRYSLVWSNKTKRTKWPRERQPPSVIFFSHEHVTRSGNVSGLYSKDTIHFFCYFCVSSSLVLDKPLWSPE